MSEISWRELAKVFDFYTAEERAKVLHDFYFWIVDQLDERAGEPQDFAELGCGTGLLAGRLVEWYPEATFHLVDNNADMLQAARERFADHPSVEIHQTGIDDFLRGLPSERLDVAVFCRSFYAVPDALQTAREVLRVLRADGRAFVYDFLEPIDVASFEPYSRAEDPERWLYLKRAMEEFNAGLRAGTYHVFSESEMRALWEQAGGRVLAYVCRKPEAVTAQLCIAKA